MAIDQLIPVATQQPEQPKPKFLHIKVIDNAREGRTAVNVKAPVGILRWGMKMARAFSPEMRDLDIDWDEVTAAIQEGGPGKIVEVEDEAQHKTVEVWLE